MSLNYKYKKYTYVYHHNVVFRSGGDEVRARQQQKIQWNWKVDSHILK